MRDEGHLPHLSPRLGQLTRTNSEAILGARTFRRGADFTRGVAITSSFHPDDHTHIEPVRYGKGSNMMGLLTTALADGDGRSRPLTWLGQVARHPVTLARNLSMRHWSEQTIIALVMQTRDNSITCTTKRGLFGRKLTSTPGPRRAEPHVDPRRPRGRPQDLRSHRRVPRRRLERRLQHPDDRALPRRRTHRRRARHRRDRPVPPRLRPPRPARASTAPPCRPTSA